MRAEPRWPLVDRVRGELDRVGPDAFVDSRVRGRDAPAALVEKMYGLPHVPERELRHHGDVSPTELRVLRMVAGGMRDREIAEALHKTVWTVRDQMKGGRRKLGARTQAHAVHLAHQRGLL